MSWIRRFKKTGPDPVADFPKTWADVAADGQKLQAAGGAKEGYIQSAYQPIREALILDGMAKQSGGGIFSADGKKAPLDIQCSDPGTSALERIRPRAEGERSRHWPYP
jgi:ABC-type glycerol-3-phosphate transport system substrate-binding protein